MNEDIVKGNWKEIKGKIKQQWGKFTDNDIAQMQGSHEELEGKLQALYGYHQDQAKKEVEEFLKHNGWKNK